MKAVSTPAGSSIGGSNIRANRSALSSKTAPMRMVAGMSTRWLPLTIIRAACGATKPIKPMLPQIDTATHASAMETTKANNRVNGTATPKLGSCRRLG